MLQCTANSLESSLFVCKAWGEDKEEGKKGKKKKEKKKKEEEKKQGMRGAFQQLRCPTAKSTATSSWWDKAIFVIPVTTEKNPSSN